MTNKPQRRIAVPPSDVATPFPILMRLPDLRPERDFRSPVTTQPAMSAAVSLTAAQEAITASIPVAITPVAESARELIAAFAAEKKSFSAPEKHPQPPPTATAELASSFSASKADDAPLPQPAAIVARSTPTANERESEAVHPQASTDEAEGEETNVAPAAARRQRALERNRRNEPTPAEPRSWWTSHAPVIAISFLLALAITVMFARSNRDRPTPEQQARLEPETQELSIEIGEPTKIPPPIALATPPGEAGSASSPSGAAPGSPATATPTKSKLPPLLGAQPAAVGNAAAPLAMPTGGSAASVATKVPAAPGNSAASDSAVDTAAESGLPVLQSANTSYPEVDNDSYLPDESVPRTARTVDTMPSAYPDPTSPNARR